MAWLNRSASLPRRRLNWVSAESTSPRFATRSTRSSRGRRMTHRLRGPGSRPVIAPKDWSLTTWHVAAPNAQRAAQSARLDTETPQGTFPKGRLVNVRGEQMAFVVAIATAPFGNAKDSPAFQSVLPFFDATTSWWRPEPRRSRNRKRRELWNSPPLPFQLFPTNTSSVRLRL